MVQGKPLVDLVLVHWPVVNKNGETIGSAVTNLDIHDIARACKTYGVSNYWIVTPFAEQQTLVGEIVQHWTKGHGGTVNPDRQHALELVKIRPSLDEVLEELASLRGVKPLVLTTCASRQEKTIEYISARTSIAEGRPVLLLFGTAWGLSPEVLAEADGTLPPITGGSEFNHLSVRSAASITLDRLLGL